MSLCLSGWPTLLAVMAVALSRGGDGIGGQNSDERDNTEAFGVAVCLTLNKSPPVTLFGINYVATHGSQASCVTATRAKLNQT